MTLESKLGWATAWSGPRMTSSGLWIQERYLLLCQIAWTIGSLRHRRVHPYMTSIETLRGLWLAEYKLEITFLPDLDEYTDDFGTTWS